MIDDGQVFVAKGDEPLREVPLTGFAPQPPDVTGPAARYPSLYPFLDRLHGALTEGASDPLLPTFAQGLRVQRVLDAVPCVRAKRPAHKGAPRTEGRRSPRRICVLTPHTPHSS